MSVRIDIDGLQDHVVEITFRDAHEPWSDTTLGDLDVAGDGGVKAAG